MDPFPEESSAFDADPADSLPSAQDLVADSIDAEAAPEPEPEKPAEEADASSSTMPAVFLMGAPSEPSSVAPLPDLVDASPLREWEEKHSAELLEKTKDEAERHKKILDAAAAEVESFNSQRNARIENMRKQNKEEEELFRENQKKLYAEGTVWQQAAKVMDMAAPKKTVKKAEPAADGAAPAAEEPKQVVEDNQRDTARMRQMLSSLKQ